MTMKCLGAPALPHITQSYSVGRNDRDILCLHRQGASRITPCVSSTPGDVSGHKDELLRYFNALCIGGRSTFQHRLVLKITQRSESPRRADFEIRQKISPGQQSPIQEPPGASMAAAPFGVASMLTVLVNMMKSFV